MKHAKLFSTFVLGSKRSILLIMFSQTQFRNFTSFFKIKGGKSQLRPLLVNACPDSRREQRY